MKLVVSTDRAEILKAIELAGKQEQNLLWQTQDDQRFIFEIEKINFDPVQEIINCELESPQDLSEDFPIYLKLSYRNTIFKGSLVRHNADQVYVRIPDEIRIEELREHPRYSFYPEEYRRITIATDNDLMSEAKLHHEVNLIDLSRSGLGLIVNQGSKDLVLNSQMITLSELGNFEFKSQFKIDPVWQIDFPFQNKQGVPELCKKVGFKFLELIPGKLLDNYLQLEEGRYGHEIGFLGQSKSFGKKFHREYLEMLRKVSSKHRFFEFFQENNDAREVGMDYLPRHIRLLSHVSCALAKLIGLGSREVMGQLTYIAFVHDIAYFNNPKLAQIKSRKHFEKVKKYLTVTEKELYFRSYNYAFEFTQAAKMTPVGCDFLMHELKNYHLAADKEAFLSQTDLDPLTAIFIVGHHLTDYIITHPKWTFYEYMERYPFLVHGKTFEVIFNSLNQARMAA